MADADTFDEAELRVELAAVFRLAAKFGWHESVANHFSAALYYVCAWYYGYLRRCGPAKKIFGE